jgi:hypothetical protein
VSAVFFSNASSPLDQLQDCLTRFVELIGFVNFERAGKLHRIRLCRLSMHQCAARRTLSLRRAPDAISLLHFPPLRFFPDRFHLKDVLKTNNGRQTPPPDEADL